MLGALAAQSTAFTRFLRLVRSVRRAWSTALVSELGCSGWVHLGCWSLVCVWPSRPCCNCTSGRQSTLVARCTRNTISGGPPGPLFLVFRTESIQDGRDH